MSYCKRYGRKVSVVNCLICINCLPPYERIYGNMCEFEVREEGNDE